MTLIELKNYINSLSDTYNDMLVVNGEFLLDKDGETFVMENNEVVTIYVDEKESVIQFLHQTDKDITDFIHDSSD